MIHIKAVAVGSVILALMVLVAAALAYYPVGFIIIGLGGSAYCFGRAALVIIDRT